MKKESKWFVCAITGLFLLLCAGCGGGGGGDDDDGDSIVLQNDVWIDPALGGRAAIQDSNGDIIQVIIPAGALAAPITLTLTELEPPPASPFQDTFFAGVRIYPDDVTFLTGAELKIRFASALSDPDVCMLFHDAGANVFLALKQNNGANEIKADIYQTGTYFGCRPTIDEADALIETGLHANSTRWQETLSVVNALNAWASFFTSQGVYDTAESARRMVQENIQNDVDAFLLEEMPADVMGAYCETGVDAYMNSAGEYQKMLRLLDEPSGLSAQLQDRLTDALEIGANRLLAENPEDPCGSYRECITDYLDLFNANDLQNHWAYESLKDLRADLDQRCEQ